MKNRYVGILFPLTPFVFYKLLFFFVVLIDDTNMAMISLQSLAILSNSLSVRNPVSFKRLSQFMVSLASFNAMESFEMKSEGL